MSTCPKYDMQEEEGWVLGSGSGGSRVTSGQVGQGRC